MVGVDRFVSAVVGVCAMMVGCAPAPQPAERRPATPPVLDAALVNWRFLDAAGHRYYSARRQPHVQVPAAVEALRVTVDGRGVALDALPADGGFRVFAFEVGPSSTPVVIEAQAQGFRARRWTTRWYDRDPAYPTAAKSAAPLSALAALPAPTPIKRVEKARAEAWVQKTSAGWARLARIAEAEGFTSEAVAAWRAVAFVALEHKDLATLDDALDRADAMLQADDPLGAARIAYHRALGAELAGDLRGAEAAHRESLSGARALGATRDARYSLESLALVHVRQGRFGAALDRFAELEAEAPLKRRASVHLNLGWTLYQGMVAGALPVELSLPRAELEAAVRLFDAVGAPVDRANAYATLAGLALRQGDLVAADLALVAAEHLDPERALYAGDWMHLIRADLALARGDLKAAAAAYTAAADLGPNQMASDPETAWRGTLGLARVDVAAGRLDPALASFEAAARRIDRLAGGVGLTDGAGHFYATRQALFDEWMRCLLDAGRPAEAWAVAELSQARVVRTLERLARRSAPEWRARARSWLKAREVYESARERAWQVPEAERAAWRTERDAARRALEVELQGLLDQTPRSDAVSLAALQRALPDDALLVSLRRVGATLHAFLVARETLTHRVLGDAWPAEWLERFARATHVFVVPGNHAPGRRLGEVEVGGEPLAAQVPISVLPHAGWLLGEPTSADGPPVVVADPEGNLRWARAEGRDLGGRRLQGANATRTAVLEAIDGARLLHFAGHGVLRPDAPWDAHLRLAAGTRLTLGDLLTARPSIGVVVLNGCATGVPLDLGGEERIGLPIAFLLGGARAVLATREDVPDAAARRFIERFHGAGGAESPATAFREAVRQSRAAQDPIWAAFELVGRP